MISPIGLETRDIWFAYEDTSPVLKGISLNIEPGEFVAMIGQNGSGKTTLVKHFNSLLKPSSGQVLLDGKDIKDQSIGALARDVGYVFQNPDHQIFSATIREEIAFGPTNLGLDESEVADRTIDALNRFGLQDIADRQPATISFGLRRLVSIAAVYAMQTPILVLDEPTTGLDQKSIDELMALILSLHHQGYTIIFITHDMRVVAEYIHRCMVIRNGKIQAYDDTRKVFQQIEILQATNIQPPQITQLGRRMADYGFPNDILSVQEFEDQYKKAVASDRKREGNNASHR